MEKIGHARQELVSGVWGIQVREEKHRWQVCIHQFYTLQQVMVWCG